MRASGNGKRLAGWAAVLGLVAAGLSGCAPVTPERRAELRAEFDKKQASEKKTATTSATTHLQAVVPHVTAAHLEECRKLLSAGGTVLDRPLAVHPQATCAMTHSTDAVFNKDRRYAVYMTTRTFNHPFGGVSHPLVGCVMRLDNGKMTVATDAPTNAPRTDICHKA